MIRAQFQCQLDGGPFGACSSPVSLSALSDGEHTFHVRAEDAGGNVDETPARRAWTVDANAPTPTITSPVAGSSMSDDTPRLAGAAGMSSGDAGVVTVKLFSGRSTAGSPLQTPIVPRDVFSGAWSREAGRVSEGTYTVRAEQTDSAGNTGLSAPVTLSVDTTAPDLALARTRSTSRMR